MEPVQNTPAVPRRIPTTEQHREQVKGIAELANPANDVVFNSRLVPTGVTLALYRDTDQNRVVTLLEASGYTATLIADRLIAVTGVISRLEMLRAERDRLTAEIAQEEHRERASTGTA